MKKKLRSRVSNTLLFLMGVFVCSSLLAQTRVTVTSTADNGPGSIRDAISVANPADTIDFAIGVGTITLTTGPVSISKALVFEGNGSTVITSPTVTPSQLFNINNADSVHFTVMTLTGGDSPLNGGAIEANNTNITIKNVVLDNNAAHGDLANQGGGAVFMNGGNLRIGMNSVVSNNTVDGTSGSGGAFLLTNGSGLIVMNTDFMSNSSSRAGGAIEINTGGSSVAITNATFDANTTGGAPGNGGAIHITGAATTSIMGSMFTNNIASAEGGAVWNGSGSMNIMASTFMNNDAQGIAASNGGGALFNLRGRMIVSSGTVIENNMASGTAGSGGGIFNDSLATLMVDNSTIRYNIAQRAGGGIEDQSFRTTSFPTDTAIYLLNTTLDSNTVNMAPGNGGGLHITGNGNVVIDMGTVNGNVAGREGGGLWNGAGTMSINGTSIIGNSALGVAANQGGGGLFNLAGIVNIDGANINNNFVDMGSASGGGVLINTGATVNISNSTIKNNRAQRAGGGIEDNSGAGLGLSLTMVNLDSNLASAAPGNGGGLHITGPGDVNITGGTVNGNVAALEGGGLWNGAGTMTIDGTLIDGNEAQGAAADQGGAGIFAFSGTVIVQNGTIISNNFADNGSASGGGILVDTTASLMASNSTIINNRARRAGGGIEFNFSTTGSITLNNANVDSNTALPMPGNGGGLHISGAGNATITGGTFNGNIAGREGGGVWNGSGIMNINGTTIDGNEALGTMANQGGAGVFANGGTVNLTSATISNNFADNGAASGGGILVNTGATVNALNSNIKNNRAQRAGGGIEDNSGTGLGLSLNNVNLDSNLASAAPGNGGGLHITGPGDVNITGGTVNGNVAALEGGGLWNGAGTMIVSGTLIDGNEAQGAAADQGGAGIFAFSGTVDLQNGTIVSNNFADNGSASGGGILVDTTASLMVSNSSIVNNRARRAGGGIEFNFSTTGSITLNNANVDSNTALPMPGNGGGLHITGAGNANIVGGTFNGNIAGREGGGVWNGAGQMTIDGTIIDGNEARGLMPNQGGGGLFNLAGIVDINNATISNNFVDSASASGGGILINTSAVVNVSNSVIKNNRSRRAGGGIEDNSGAGLGLTLNNVNVDSNSTLPMPGNGGGLHITGAGDVNITGGTFNANLAGREGGGVWNGAGQMIIDGTKIDGNEARGFLPTQGGGGLFNLAGTVNIDNATISNNFVDSASASGGGILINTGATVNVNNTIIKNNRAQRAGGGIEDNSGAGTNLSLTDVNLDSNIASAAPGNGGGLHISGDGSVDIMRGTVNGNLAAREGGGLWNSNGTMTIDGTIIDGNEARGGAANQGGAGVFANSGIVNIDNATISNNFADSVSASGGGILVNVGARVNISNSIVKNNRSKRAGGGIEDNSGAGLGLTLDNVNLDSNITSAAPGNGGGLHITGSGNVTIIGGTVNGNIAAAEGGGLWNGAGSMTVESTSINGNTANGTASDQGGAGIYNLSGILSITGGNISGNSAIMGSASGGGILNDATGTLTVTGTRISNNIASRAGGGVEDNSGPTTSITFTNVNLDSNTASSSPGNGGGLHITGAGSATYIGGSVIRNFAAAEGGGLWNGAGSMLVENTMLSSNTANGLDSDQGGGALYNLSGNLTVNSSTFEDNSAQMGLGSGGAILNDAAATLTVIDSRFENNRARRAGGAIEDNSRAGTILNITNAIFEANTAGTMPGNGGAIHITGDGDININNSSFIENIASSEGGALWNGAGSMSVVQGTFTGNRASGAAADQGGGAIYNLSGTLSVTGNSSFSDNVAAGTSGSGGAILNDANATLTLRNAVFNSNSASRAGGAIEDNSGATTTVIISNSEFTANSTGSAPGNGGAIHITGAGNMQLDTILATANIAANEGGAIWNGSGVMTVKTSRIEENISNGAGSEDGGGAFFNNGGTLSILNSSISTNMALGNMGSGGAISNVGGTLVVDNTTISSNMANNFGGAIYNRGSFVASNATIVLNESATIGGGIYQNASTDLLTLEETLLAANIATAGQDLSADSGTVTSNNYNLIGNDDKNQFNAAANDQVGTSSAPINPMLMPLADNGGITLTHSFLDGSLALNGANPANLDLDQIGQPVFGGIKDVGAYECQTCSAVGINENESKTDFAVVYPNPTSGNEVSITTQSNSPVSILLIDNSGKQLAKSTGNGQVSISTANLVAGSYLLRIESEGKLQISKLIKL